MSRAWIVVLIAACGPQPSSLIDGDARTNGPDAHAIIDARPAYPTGGLTGTVYAPGNAPGMVPAGQEIPISGALVYVSGTLPDPIPTTIYPDQCVDPPGTTAVTDSRGQFTLNPIIAQTWYLVVQKGQFRIVTPIDVIEDQVTTVNAELTTLPSVNDPTNGKTIPSIALAVGTYDAVETVMGKMDLGTVDGTGDFVGWEAGVPDFTFYNNGGSLPSGISAIPLNTLVNDLTLMRQFHIIFIPCSSGDNNQLFTSPTIRDNIRSYVAEGGKWYVTDWSAEWEDVVFPEFIVFASDHDTPAGASSSSSFNDGDGSPSYSSEGARAADADLQTWLTGQYGPDVDSGTLMTFDGSDFFVEGNWNHIVSLPPINIGVDDEGFPVTEQAKIWVEGPDGYDTTMHPLTVTFEPIGYGRVLYSTYHTAGMPSSPHVGLVPQERVLLYLIMEIGVCKSGPVVL